eukprot:gene2927-2595_t
MGSQFHSDGTQELLAKTVAGTGACQVRMWHRQSPHHARATKAMYY